MRRYLIFLAIAACSGLSNQAACARDSDWTTLALPERAHDFGTVARGSLVRHSFPVINRTSSEIRIATWQPKCGCTDVRVGARVIPPGTQTTVEATIDTTRFQGYKASGLVLVLDYPTFAKIDLNLTCYIRGDVTLEPGQLDFGAVRPVGQLPSATLNLIYSGSKSNWEISEMKTQTAQVKAEAKEDRADGRQDPVADHRDPAAWPPARLLQGRDYRDHQ